jgi:hypothetical protein
VISASDARSPRPLEMRSTIAMEIPPGYYVSPETNM